MNSETYLKERVEDQINWYDKIDIIYFKYPPFKKILKIDTNIPAIISKSLNL